MAHTVAVETWCPHQTPNTDNKQETDLLQLLPGCCKLPFQLGFSGLMLLQRNMLLDGNLLKLCLLAVQLAPQLLLTGTLWGERVSLCLTARACYEGASPEAALAKVLAHRVAGEGRDM